MTRPPPSLNLIVETTKFEGKATATRHPTPLAPEAPDGVYDPRPSGPYGYAGLAQLVERLICNQ